MWCIFARTYLQTPLRVPEFFPIGQRNRFKKREARHLTDPLALKLVRNGTKVSLTGSLMQYLSITFHLLFAQIWSKIWAYNTIEASIPGPLVWLSSIFLQDVNAEIDR